MSSTTQPRIAIVGAGPAGLTVGLLLHNRGVPFTIYELRQKPTDEELARPSGMLDLHNESGIAALRECGLYDEFVKLIGECTEAQKVADKDGNVLYEDDGGMSERPEISRHNLTKLLVSHLPPSRIRWNHKLGSATMTGHGEVELDFGPHDKHVFDLVIGADGTWSRVRGLLTDTKPQYSGVQWTALTIRGASTKYAHLEQLVGLGTFSALGYRHGVMTQRGPQDSVRVSIFLSTDDQDFATNNGLVNQPVLAVKERLLSDDTLLGNWGSLMKELVSTACDEEAADNPHAEADIRGLYKLPIDHRWEHKSSVTLIGDASHVMGPWAGEGVNLAMWDSLLLARAIIRAYEAGGQESASFRRALEPLMMEFERDMAERAKEKAEETESNGKMLFDDDAANRFVAFFRSFMPEETGS